MSAPLTSYNLSWPRELDEHAVRAFFRALAADAAPGPVVLDVFAHQGSLRHVLSLPPARASQLTRQLMTVVPGVRVEPLDKRVVPDVRRALRLKLTTRRRALRSDTASDTATTILSALSGARRDEVLHLQWVLGPRLRPVAIPNNFVDFKRTATLPALLSAPLSPPARVDPEQRLALRDKQSLSGWRAVGRIGVRANSPNRERQLLQGVIAALRVTEAPGLRLEARATPAAKLISRHVPCLWPMALNEVEIIGLAGWPLGELALPGLVRSPYALASAAPTVARSGRVIGDVNYPGSDRAVALNGRDAAHHLLILGPTGVGKSTLMGQLALADAARGNGLILIDNKRDLVDDVLARLAADRLDDVVDLDLSNHGSVVGFNPLAGTPEQAPLLADRLVHIFRQIYGENLGPRSEDILHAGLLTLALHGGQTLPMLPLLFTSASYRRRLTANLDDPLGLGSFWSWFEGTSEAERRAATAPLMNKLRAVLLRPALRRALGQAEPRFSIRQVFTERKILLVNLAKGTSARKRPNCLGRCF